MNTPEWVRQSDSPTLSAFFWCMANKDKLLSETRAIEAKFNKKCQNA